MSPALALARRLQPRVAVSLLGTGQVGSALLRQLAEGEERGESLRIVAVANSRKTLADRGGIRPGEAMARLWAEGIGPEAEAPLAALEEAAADVRVMVDATAAPQVAARHARWLARGVH